jgi:hypothetical protein
MFFSTPRRSDPALGSPSHLSHGFGRLFTRGKRRPGHESDHLPPFSVEVKNSGAVPSLLHIPSWYSVWEPTTTLVNQPGPQQCQRPLGRAPLATANKDADLVGAALTSRQLI